MKDLSHNFKGAEYFVSILEGLPSLEEIMGYTIPMMGIPLKSKQVLLEIDLLKERTLSFIDYIIREKTRFIYSWKSVKNIHSVRIKAIVKR